MSGSLKRHPSTDPEESPKAKRRLSAEEVAPKALEQEEEKSAELHSFLSPPTKVGGFSITDKANISDDKSTSNGKSNSIMNSGFKLSTGASLFSNGNVAKTNIFSDALANVNGSGAGIFGSASTSSSSNSFVFGANLSDRVVTAPKEDEAPKPDTSPSPPEKTETNSDKLVEAKVTSGEEGEKRLIQTTCKLYQFSQQGESWVERGGGTLRLNEKEVDGRSSSRLVVRSKAVMKVMLNTKIFADMIINRPNLTMIRISALDNGKMGTFLLKCTRNECDRLHTMLLKRRELERRQEQEFSGESSKTAPEGNVEQTTEGNVEEGKAKEEEDTRTKPSEDDTKTEEDNKTTEDASEEKAKEISETPAEGTPAEETPVETLAEEAPSDSKEEAPGAVSDTKEGAVSDTKEGAVSNTKEEAVSDTKEGADEKDSEHADDTAVP